MNHESVHDHQDHAKKWPCDNRELNRGHAAAISEKSADPDADPLKHAAAQMKVRHK